MKTPTHPHDAQRLEALREYAVLDTPAEQSYDDLTLLAAHICETPMASVSFVDEHRQWFKSRIGVEASETSRDIAFCAHTILHKDQVFEVRDARTDSRFKDSPLVTEGPHIRFYAGAPLIAPNGQALGALCVMDRAPRALTTAQSGALQALSRQVISLLESRRQADELAREVAERQRAQTLLHEQFQQLSAGKREGDRLLAMAQKSRRVLLGVLEDEKLSGQKLRESEEKFRQLADNITDVFWMTSPDLGAIHYISAGYEVIWGRSAASLYANPHQWIEAILPEERERVFAVFGTLMAKAPEVSVEYRIARPDGSVRWILDRGFQVRDAAGNLIRLTGIASDITERKLAEQRLDMQGIVSRVLAEANTLNDATPKIIQAICESEGWDFGGFWELDKKANALRSVETWCRPELPGQELAALTRGLTFTSNTGLPGRVWASGKPLLIPEIGADNNFPRAALALKTGLRSAVAFPVILEGNVIGVMDFLGREMRALDEKMLEMFPGIGRQIGAFIKRKQLEDQFRQSQKMESIGQLAGGVAHDFNNILAVIQMQSDLLKGSQGLTAEQSEFADEIGVTVERAAALTRQLLLFSRREVFQPRDLDLSETVTSTAKMLRRVLGENVQMQLKLAPQPLFINADPGMMDQVLLNLSVNARDAMPNGGQLVIETFGLELDEFAAAQSAQARPGSFVCLSVSDSGCGIPPEILPKIFEPFFTTKEVGKGTGLGLATVFGIAQQHQGWVAVYSEVGHGTTFRVYLPRLAGNADRTAAPSAVTARRGGGETVLLVEDDPSLRVSVRKSLSQLGYRILEAPTGIKALEVWKQNRDEIRLLLTDLVMPDGMTGKDLAQRVLGENPDLKVIYMSGYSAEVVGKDFPLKEGDNFLTKPFQASKLARTIREKLDAKI
jgi:PAS domain S-box-containing protein